jgi:hypothetical protein
MVQRRVIAISALNQSFAIAERSIKVWHRECTKSGCNEVKFATEDTPIAVSNLAIVRFSQNGNGDRIGGRHLLLARSHAHRLIRRDAAVVIVRWSPHRSV